MNSFPLRFTFFLAILFAAEKAWPTTTAPITVKCPVCGEKIDAKEVMSTNSFGGMDTDLLHRARGTQPLLIFPLVCTLCYYAGFQDDFNEKVTISEDFKKKMHNELKPPLPIRKDEKSFQVPAWVRYDLIAQRLNLAGKPAEDLANMYIRCVWAVRLEADLSEMNFTKADYDRIEALVKQQGWEQTDQQENDAEYEVELGLRLSGYVASAPEKDQRLVGLAAVRLLREHGENIPAIEALNHLKCVIPETQYKKIEKQLLDSIHLERSYQEKVLNLLEKIVKNEKQENRGVLLYLCGEINRRWGRIPEAMAWYDQAATVGGPEDFVDLVKKQRKAASLQKPSSPPNDAKSEKVQEEKIK
jgi:uncharacterized protein (DUF2225 family)